MLKQKTSAEHEETTAQTKNEAPSADNGGKIPRGEGKGEKKHRHPFWRTLFPYLLPYRRQLVFTVVFSLLTGVCVAIQPLIIKYIVDTGISGAPIAFFGKTVFVMPEGMQAHVTFILAACGLYVLVSLLRMSCWAALLSNMLKAMEGTLFTLRSRFFGHVQHMCMRFYDKNSSGELYNYIMGSPMANIKNFLTSVVQSVPYQAVSLAISLTALFSYSWKLTVLTLVTSVVMTLLYRSSRQKVRRASREYLSAENEASQYISDMLHGSEAVKMYSIEDITVKRFEEQIDTLRKRGIQYNITSFLEHIKPEFTQYLGIAAVYLVGGILCLRGEITVGILYAFLSSMTTILATLSAWLNLALTRHSAAEALDRVAQIIDENSTTPEVAASLRRSVAIEKESAIAHGRPCIAFEHVDFAYDNKPIFKDFSCQIAYGESIGLVGGSGSGKSTFTKLIMRLYEVNGGQILVHGRNVKDYETHELRMSFGVVPQNPFIFYGTVWDNVRIACPDASNREIIEAMEVARVHEFVNDLPMGWSTLIGDGALGLSGGQKQRIAIARAVLKKPDIFIFDEATSALDNISEHLIQEAMEELMKSHTVIFVAHRLSTIRNVDRILVLDHGNIIQEGNFEKLAAEEGEFRRLLDAAEATAGLHEMQKKLP